MKAATKTAPDIGRMRYRINEVAKLAGVSRRTVYTALNTGALKAARLGGTGRYGITPADLTAWVEGRPK